jgi:hypothetical protein
VWQQSVDSAKEVVAIGDPLTATAADGLRNADAVARVPLPGDGAALNDEQRGVSGQFQTEDDEPKHD